MVVQQILVLRVRVRILVGQLYFVDSQSLTPHTQRLNCFDRLPQSYPVHSALLSESTAISSTIGSHSLTTAKAPSTLGDPQNYSVKPPHVIRHSVLHL